MQPEFIASKYHAYGFFCTMNLDKQKRRQIDTALLSALIYHKYNNVDSTKNIHLTNPIKEEIERQIGLYTQQIRQIEGSLSREKAIISAQNKARCQRYNQIVLSRKLKTSSGVPVECAPIIDQDDIFFDGLPPLEALFDVIKSSAKYIDEALDELST